VPTTVTTMPMTICDVQPRMRIPRDQSAWQAHTRS
jgi:hypothetical protein